MFELYNEAWITAELVLSRSLILRVDRPLASLFTGLKAVRGSAQTPTACALAITLLLLLRGFFIIRLQDVMVHTN